MNALMRLLVMSLIIVFVTACGGGGEPAPESDPLVGTVRLQNNNTSLSITEANLSPVNQTTWGINYITTPLAAGFYGDLTNVPVGSYDGRARSIGLYSTYSTYLYNIPVVDGGLFTIYTTDSGYTGSLKIVNGTTNANIIGLYVSPSASSTWGTNQINSQIVPSGSMHLYDILTTLYDVKVVWDIGADSIYTSGAITSLTLLTLTVN